MWFDVKNYEEKCMPDLTWRNMDIGRMEEEEEGGSGCKKEIGPYGHVESWFYFYLYFYILFFHITHYKKWH